MKIAFYGSALNEINSRMKFVAYEIGRVIALKGHELVTGACEGYPLSATKGALEVGGITTGFSRGRSLFEHLRLEDPPAHYFTNLHYINGNIPGTENEGFRRNLRNLNSANYVDAGIIMAGGNGTMNEYTNLLTLEKNVVIIMGSGGIAGHDIMSFLAGNSNSKFSFRIESNSIVDFLESAKTYKLSERTK